MIMYGYSQRIVSRPADMLASYLGTRKFDSDEIETAIHEAAHAAVAMKHGFHTTEVAVDPDDRRTGHCHYTPGARPTALIELRLWAFQRITIAMAGQAAAERFLDGPYGFRANLGNGSDQRNIEDYLDQGGWTGSARAEVRTKAKKWLWRMLPKLSDDIDRMAVELIRSKKPLDAKRIRELSTDAIELRMSNTLKVLESTRGKSEPPRWLVS